jgi:O-methyltransferase
MAKLYPRGYGLVTPQADYRPWDVDPEFSRLFRAVEAHTKVDIARCHELWELLEQCRHLEGDVLEVGVWRGGTGALLAAGARRLWGDSRRVFLADTFRGVVKAGPKDDYYRGGEHADTSPEVVRQLLGSMELSNTELLEGIFPEETGGVIADRRFCFCHVDVDVYQSARDTVEWVWPRIPVGGVVVYDDYGFYGCEGVTALGREDRLREDRVFVHNLNGHGILVKLR